MKKAEFKTLLKESTIEICETENNNQKVIDLLTNISNNLESLDNQNNEVFEGLRQLNLTHLNTDIDDIRKSFYHATTSNYERVRIQLKSIEEAVNELFD